MPLVILGLRIYSYTISHLNNGKNTKILSQNVDFAVSEVQIYILNKQRRKIWHSAVLFALAIRGGYFPKIFNLK